MRMEIERHFTFEAAHRLPHVPEGHKCGTMHGHSFGITVTVVGPVDPKTGWVVDFSELDTAWAPIKKLVDHQTLNTVEGLENPTSELIAIWVANKLKAPAKTKLVKVYVSETCRSACTYYCDG